MGTITGLFSRNTYQIEDRCTHFFNSAHCKIANIKKTNDQICGILVAEQLYNDSFIFDLEEKHVIFEGEIYNIKEIACRLFPKYANKAHSNPAAIIFLLYKKFGLKFPRYLNGVFSCAIWDGTEQRLHLCRDHVGSHSIFYSVSSNTIVFSSSIRNIFKIDAAIPSEISKFAINQYFASRALTPPITMFKNIAAVPPGHIVSIRSANKIDLYDYWELCEIDVVETVSEDEFVERLRNIIFDAIEIRGNYSRPFGVIVSGGLDTGIVAARLSNLSPCELDAFSITFRENTYSDAQLQDIIINTFQLKHHQVILGPNDFADELCRSIHFLDAPLNDVAFVGMSKTFQLVQQAGLKVVFEGEGPDEIFPAGNTQGEFQLRHFLALPAFFRHKILGSLFTTMPLGDSFTKKILRVLVRISMDDDERRLTWRTYFHNKLRKKLLAPDYFDRSDPYLYQRKYLNNCKNRDSINKYQYGLIRTFLPDNLLFKDQRMASGNGIINRVPLIDHRIIELALKIPSKMQIAKPDKYSDGIKLLYKKALKGNLPEAIIKHKKVRGFSHPTSEWYRNELKDLVSDILLGSTTRQRGIFNMQFVEEILQKHFAGTADYDYPISALLIFELWMRAHYDSLKN